MQGIWSKGEGDEEGTERGGGGKEGECRGEQRGKGTEGREGEIVQWK